MDDVNNALVSAIGAAELESGEPVVIRSIWAGDNCVVVLWRLASVVWGGPVQAAIVPRGSPEVPLTVRLVPRAEVDLSGMVRVPWQPWRPVDPSVPSARIRTCRRCGGRLVPVVWGMPDEELWAQSQRGEVAIGGCIVPGPDDEQWSKECRSCGWRLVVEPNVPTG